MKRQRKKKGEFTCVADGLRDTRHFSEGKNRCSLLSVSLQSSVGLSLQPSVGLSLQPSGGLSLQLSVRAIVAALCRVIVAVLLRIILYPRKVSQRVFFPLHHQQPFSNTTPSFNFSEISRIRSHAWKTTRSIPMLCTSGTERGRASVERTSDVGEISHEGPSANP